MIEIKPDTPAIISLAVAATEQPPETVSMCMSGPTPFRAYFFVQPV